MIRVDEKVHAVRPGQFFANRYRVNAIKDRYVVIESLQGFRSLRIGENGTPEEFKVVNRSDYEQIITEDNAKTSFRNPFLVGPHIPYGFYNDIEPHYIGYDNELLAGFTLTGDIFNILGLRPDDIITEYDGVQFSTYTQIADMIHNLNKKEIEIEYIRNGRYRSLRLLLGVSDRLDF